MIPAFCVCVCVCPPQYTGRSGPSATFPPSLCWLRGEPVINLVTLELIYTYSLYPTQGLTLKRKQLPCLLFATRWLSGFAQHPFPEVLTT